MYRTIMGVLYPEGRIEFSEEESMNYPVEVMVTILDEGLREELSELSSMGDYLKNLNLYEDQLAQGKFLWK